MRVLKAKATRSNSAGFRRSSKSKADQKNHRQILYRKSILSAILMGLVAFFFGVLAQAAGSVVNNGNAGTGIVSDFELRSWRENLRLALARQDKPQIDKLILFKSVESQAFSSGNLSNHGDRQAMVRGRELFGQGKFLEAIEQYNKVSKDSDYWLEAVEEKSWAYLRLGDYEKSLAQVKTLVSPVFVSAIGPEPFLLKIIAELKICDYKGMFATLREFKTAQRDRVLAINKLADSGDSKELQEALNLVNKFPIDSLEIGKAQKLLPRLFYLDHHVKHSVLQIKFYDELLNLAEGENGNFLNAVYASQNEGLPLRTEARRRLKEAREGLRKRMMSLADQEAREYQRIVEKLQLAEVEVTQRVFADAGRKIEKKSSGFHTNPDDLMFLDNGEVWIDELDKFEAKVNACESNVRRKM